MNVAIGISEIAYHILSYRFINYFKYSLLSLCAYCSFYVSMTKGKMHFDLFY